MARITVSYFFTAGRDDPDSSKDALRAARLSQGLLAPQPRPASAGHHHNGGSSQRKLYVVGTQAAGCSQCQVSAATMSYPSLLPEPLATARLPFLAWHVASVAWLKPGPSEGSAADSVAVCASTSWVSLMVAPSGFSFPACLLGLFIFATFSRILQDVFTDVINVPLALQQEMLLSVKVLSHMLLPLWAYMFTELI